MHYLHSQTQFCNQNHRSNHSTIIRGELIGSDRCSALGMTVRSSSPVLTLCRQLVENGHNPATPLEAYRGDTLALRVKSIGQAAQLRMSVSETGAPVFRRRETVAAAPPIRRNLEAAE